MNISELEPRAVWEHFQVLCEIPRPSKHEQQIRDYLQGWAELHELAVQQDQAGNLIVRKPATPGMENRPGVVLQGHLDMVCQANAGTVHDFLRDPLSPVLKEGWLVAENTTLGADNGIGVALALAVLASRDLAHGPIEALFTLDEEQGMGGALGLAPGLLQGRYLINLDTEEWGEFYMGCAGGVDVNIRRRYQSEALPARMVVSRLALTGLQGGHSGAEIHCGRGNANKLLLRVLVELGQACDLRLIRFNGGTARNALAREAFAVVAWPQEEQARAQALLDRVQQTLRLELAGVDAAVTLTATPAPGASVMTRADQKLLLSALHAAPHGVRSMSHRLDGVVETSNNLGVIDLADGELQANLMVRSLLDSGTWMLAQEIRSLFSLIDAEVEFEGAYPGWTPNPDSVLLALCREVYQREYQQESGIKVIHAGLECGIIAAKYPQLDMVSFGPDIRGAHAPGERVNVAAVGRVWHLLQAVLAAIPAQ
jgi:dipeptidase D